MGTRKVTVGTEKETMSTGKAIGNRKGWPTQEGNGGH